MGRIFSFLSLIIVVAVGMYIYSKQAQGSSAAAGANNPKAAINITAVRTDLIGIASAERRYFATESRYGSLDELVSGSYIPAAPQRPPYTFDIQTSSSGFRVTATRSGDDAPGGPAQLSIDESMEIKTSE